METKNDKPQRQRLNGAAFSIVMLLLVAACASNPKPVAEIAAASTALEIAQSKEAKEYAPVPMDRANEKLRRANQAMQKKDYAEAKRLAEEAKADAELAQALADKAQVETAVRELESSIEILREEIERAREY